MSDILFDKALDLSFRAKNYLMNFTKKYQAYKYGSDNELSAFCSLSYRYFILLQANSDPYTLLEKFTDQEMKEAFDKSIEYFSELCSN